MASIFTWLQDHFISQNRWPKEDADSEQDQHGLSKNSFGFAQKFNQTRLSPQQYYNKVYRRQP